MVPKHELVEEKRLREKIIMSSSSLQISVTKKYIHKSNAFGTVFEILRKLVHPFSCHILITMQRGRQRRWDDLHAAAEDAEFQGGQRSQGFLDNG